MLINMNNTVDTADVLVEEYISYRIMYNMFM